MLVDKNVAFCPIFSPDRSGCALPFLWLSELLSYTHQYFAISRKCLRVHHIPQVLSSKVSGKNLRFPICENSDEHCWNSRIHAAGLSIRSEERRVGKECRSRWS